MRISKELYFIVLLTLFGISIAFYFGYSSLGGHDYISLVLTVISIITASLAWYLTTEKYLNKDIKKELEKPTLRIIEKKTDANQFTRNVAVGGDDEYDEILRSLIEEKIRSFRDDNPKEYAYDDQIALRRGDVFRAFETTENRLLKEIGNLTRRANINLTIGGVIAFIGIAGLTAFVFSTSKDIESLSVLSLVVHWVVRLSLVALVEIFAFFFLRIYKTELTSIQYYQDELTSIESRKIALLFAVLQNSEESTCKSISCLLEIDRNFKMDVNQTTAEIEKLKIENSFIKSQMDSFFDIFKGVLSFRRKEDTR